LTLDTFKMEAITVLDQPDLLTACVRRLLSEERNRQLKDIRVKHDYMSLSYLIRIDMLIGDADLRSGMIEIPEFTTGLSSSLVIEKTLNRIEDIVTKVGK